MKPRHKKMFLWLLLALVPAAAAVLAVRNPGNVAQTRPDHPEPTLRTRRATPHAGRVRAADGPPDAVVQRHA